MRVANKTRFTIFIITIGIICGGLIAAVSKAIMTLFEQESVTVQTQTTINEQADETQPIIIIDAGHGGFDNGTTSPFSGAHEQYLNLQVARKLQKKFETNGYTVDMLREDDHALAGNKDDDMAIRQTSIAQNTQGISISIHMNSYPQDSKISGPEVYYYPGQAEGEKLAQFIQQSLNTKLNPPKRRTIMAYGYLILSKAEAAAVLVECGFLTNQTEEALLCDSEYQNQLADAIYRGAVDYLENKGKEYCDD